MAWQGIFGHDPIVERFRKSLERGRLSGSFLFVGPAGIGKRTFAFALGKALLCRESGANTLDPCDVCESCRMFGPGDFPASTHPDFHFVRKPQDKSLLPLELLIGDKEHRGKSGLCYEISRTPFMGGRRVALIDDADFFNQEGANSLLKTLEEPPVHSVMILIGTSTAKQLPTIRSRCQVVRFSPLSDNDLANILLKHAHVTSLEQGLRLAAHSNGGVESALALMDESLDAIRDELNRELRASRIQSVKLAKRLCEYIEAAGKDAAPRRMRLHSVLTIAVEEFRRQLANTPPHCDATITVRKLERTLDADEQVDRNLNVPYIVEAWTQAIGE